MQQLKKLMNLFIRLNKNFKINKKSPYGDGRASKKLLNFYSSKKFYNDNCSFKYL